MPPPLRRPGLAPPPTLLLRLVQSERASSAIGEEAFCFLRSETRRRTAAPPLKFTPASLDLSAERLLLDPTNVSVRQLLCARRTLTSASESRQATYTESKETEPTKPAKPASSFSGPSRGKDSKKKTFTFARAAALLAASGGLVGAWLSLGGADFAKSWKVGDGLSPPPELAADGARRDQPLRTATVSREKDQLLSVNANASQTLLHSAVDGLQRDRKSGVAKKDSGIPGVEEVAILSSREALPSDSSSSPRQEALAEAHAIEEALRVWGKALLQREEKLCVSKAASRERRSDELRRLLHASPKTSPAPQASCLESLSLQKSVAEEETAEKAVQTGGGNSFQRPSAQSVLSETGKNWCASELNDEESTSASRLHLLQQLNSALEELDTLRRFQSLKESQAVEAAKEEAYVEAAADFQQIFERRLRQLERERTAALAAARDEIEDRVRREVTLELAEALKEGDEVLAELASRVCRMQETLGTVVKRAEAAESLTSAWRSLAAVNIALASEEAPTASVLTLQKTAETDDFVQVVLQSVEAPLRRFQNRALPPPSQEKVRVEGAKGNGSFQASRGERNASTLMWTLRDLQHELESIIRRCVRTAFLTKGGGVFDHFRAFLYGTFYSIGIALPSVGIARRGGEVALQEPERQQLARNLAVLAAARGCLRRGNTVAALERLSDLEGLVAEEARRETAEIRDGVLLRQALSLIGARLECRLWQQLRSGKASS